MLYEVSLTKDAERDLEELYLYIAGASPAVANPSSLEFERTSRRPLE